MPNIGPLLPSTTQFQVPVANSQQPAEGPKVTAVTYNFSNAITQITTNLYQLMASQSMSMVQGMFVDNSNNPTQVEIVPSIINENIIVPAFSQAILPIFCPKNALITVTSLGQVPVTIDFCNFPVPAEVWNVQQGSPARTMNTGQVALVGGTAGQILAANPLRIGAIISNQSGATIYIGQSNTVTASNGLAIPNGGTFNTGELGTYTGAIWGFAAANETVTFAEFTN